jgi:predicted RNase H-like nuclease
MSDPDAEQPKHPKRLANQKATRPRHSKKDYDALVAAAWDAGWWCETRGSNYIACYPPDGSAFVMVPSTPSSQRTLRNLRSRFKRAGLDV